MCREKVLLAFIAWVPVLAIEIALKMLSPNLGNQARMHMYVYTYACMRVSERASEQVSEIER